MDALTMLKNDHKTVEQLFKRFEKAGDRAYTVKRDTVDRMIEELAVHAAVEEQVFYPVVRATVPKAEDITLESLEEHHIVKWVLSELDGMSPKDERFDAKVTVLIENVRHHVKEEEGDLFPKVRNALGRGALNELGNAMEGAKKIAPTHPHPRSPDTPPGNVAIGAAAGVADRVTDTVSGLAQGGVSAVNDIIAAVTGRRKPSARPTGSKGTRKVATRVRSSASDAATEVVRKAQRTGRTARATGASATAGAKRTARAAKSGARGTATTARKSAKRTATTAKRGATTTRRTASKATKATKRTAKTARRSPAKTARRSSARTAKRAR